MENAKHGSISHRHTGSQNVTYGSVENSPIKAPAGSATLPTGTPQRENHPKATFVANQGKSTAFNYGNRGLSSSEMEDSENNEEVGEFDEASILDLTFYQKVAASSGHVLNDICASMWFSYYLMFAQKVAGFSSNMAALLMFLGQMVDAFATPLVGYEADQGFGQNDYWPCRSSFGRYKSWHLLGVVMSTIAFPFIFSPVIGYTEGSSDWVKAIYYAPFITIYETGWACTQIAHLALIPKINPDVLTRTEILAMRFVLTVAANVALFLMVSFIIGFSENCVINEKDSNSFMNIALMTVGIGVFFTIIFYLIVKEYPDERVKVAVQQWTRRERFLRRKAQSRGSTQEERQHIAQPSGNYTEEIHDLDSPLIPVRAKRHSTQQVGIDFEDPSQMGIIAMYSTKRLNLGMDMMNAKDWIKLPQFYWVAVVYISSRLVINVPQAYMPLYLQETLHLSCSAIATIPMTYFTAGFFIATCIKLINKYFGRQISFIFGTVLNFIGSVIILYGDWSPTGFLHRQGIYIVFALLGGGASAGMITSLSITADMIGNNVESGAFVYGSMSFCDKMSCGLIVLLINSLSPQRLTVAATHQTEEFYRNVMGYSNIACSLLGIFGVIALTGLIHSHNKSVLGGGSNTNQPQRTSSA